MANDSKYERADELSSAVCNNDEKRVSTLLEEGVDVHYNDNEALWLAISNRFAGITLLLLDSGAYIDDRDGEIWELACTKNSIDDEFSYLVQLGANAISGLDYVSQLDDALNKGNAIFVDFLIQRFPSELNAEGLILGMEYRKSNVVEYFLEKEVNFDLCNVESAHILFIAWNSGYSHLMPKLVKFGVDISDAIHDYQFGSYISASSLPSEFLGKLLKLSEYDSDVCESIASIGIDNKQFDVAVDAISGIAHEADKLAYIFLRALLCDAEVLYPLLMKLKADIQLNETDDIDWLNPFVSHCTDRDLVCYLLLRAGPWVAKDGYLLDKAIEDGDTEWAKTLILLGVESNKPMYMNAELAKLIDNIEEDKLYQFEVYLNLAEKFGGKPAEEVADAFMQGHVVEQDTPRAIFWYRQAVNWGNTSAMRKLAKILATGDGVEQNKQEAISLYRTFTKDTTFVRDLEVHEMSDDQVISRLVVMIP
ncbi:hypothetical protein VA249_18430 [Vibrio alfacsensis]|uniref:tetratricopeptide repeat protein n=1 Tax=Vibrio alfacsensis TaxID=1074311 RepID=UPI001BEE1898|nr:tetratricopeptide repeat protein [Vibrio alfacsensis]BBM65197.1 hypothetical protein VA249_18430 [Vibrio alfacsensis]